MATAVEVANAYVALTVKAPNIKRDIEDALGADRTGQNLGKQLTTGLGKGFKVGLAAVAGTLAVGLGTALSKGFQRITAIDDARAKLSGFGHDAEAVQKIMDNALASVKGTAFGLGDAATVAAQAVAAGVKPGRDLERVLGIVANSAAAAGTDLGSMGSVFSKAMTQANGVQNDVIQQLADRGIPIYQALADQLGVTAGEVFKLASEGKVNFETFAAAAQAATGTVASEMGGTWSGSFDNFMASLGRIGEGLLSGLFPQLKGGLQDVTEWLAPFEDGAKEVGAAVGEFVATNGPKLVDVLKGIWDAGSNVVQWVKDNVTWLGPLVAGLGAAAGAVVAWNLAVKGAAAVQAAVVAVQATWTAITYGQVGATYAASGAQKVLNAVMKANPIMLIVTAITALVGALVWFFTQTELGKQIWGEFSRFLGEAWANITAAAQWAWENVLKPVFEGIGAVVTWVYQNIIQPVFTLIVNYFRFWGAVAVWLWVNVIQPVFKQIGQIFNWVWTTIIKPVIDWISAAIRVLGTVFNWLYVNIVKPVWDGISKVISAAWTWIDKHVFSPFKTGIDLIAKGFEVARKSIETTWNGIKKAAAVPINFVLDTVWNNGLRSFWNDLVTNLGLKDMKLPKASLVKFATGGVLPGYTPGRDVHEFYSPTGGRLALSGGEAIMRPEFTRLVGGKAGVDALNRAARQGRLAFKDGGVWGNLNDFAGDVWDNVTRAAAVVGEFLADPVKAVQRHVIDGIIKPLTGDGNIIMRTVAQLPINLVKNLAKNFGAAGGPSAGKAGMGWQAMWNIVKANVPGAVMTSNYRSPGANARVGGAKGSYHMQGRAIDVIPANMATFNAIRNLFPNATELIYTPAGKRQLRNGKPFDGWSAAVKRQHYSHVHVALANGGVVPKLYDQGGWLPHGGIAVNQSGKPEAVLTPEESKALKDGKGKTVNVTFVNPVVRDPFRDAWEAAQLAAADL